MSVRECTVCVCVFVCLCVNVSLALPDVCERVYSPRFMCLCVNVSLARHDVCERVYSLSLCVCVLMCLWCSVEEPHQGKPKGMELLSC